MYDCTFYVENDFDVSIAHWLKGNPSTITLVCSRIDLSDIPTDPDESKAYLNQLFHEKVPSNDCRPGLLDQGLNRELLVPSPKTLANNLAEDELFLGWNHRKNDEWARCWRICVWKFKSPSPANKKATNRKTCILETFYFYSYLVYDHNGANIKDMSVLCYLFVYW